MQPPARRPYKGARPCDAKTADDGAARAAWVVLVMLGDAYVPGALVVAQSLRTVKTRHAVVCMVTADVTEAARAQLRELYDRVVEVPFIGYPSRPMPSAKQADMYGAWIARSYTKWNVLGLTDCAKTILVDADMLFLANCDELFELRAPAACYSFAWAEPWRRGGVPNGYGELAHGAQVPAAEVLRAVDGRGRAFVGAASIMLLAPDAARLRALHALLGAAAPQAYAAESGAVNGVDEISIAELYARAGTDWTHIHPRYTAIPWKTRWVSRDIRAYHYQGRKPWLMDADEWPDLKEWWTEARRLPAAAQAFIGLAAATALAPWTPVMVAAAELQLTRELVLRVTSASPHGPRTREPRAVMALMPWLAALAAASHGAKRGWSKLYRETTIGETDCNNDLAGTLIAHQLVAPQAAGALVRELVSRVAKRISRPPARIAAARVLAGADLLGYGAHYSTQIDQGIASHIAAAGAEATLASLMRHAAALSAVDPTGGPTLDRLGALYDQGFRFEGFATPFARVFAGREGASYCSAFPDTDKALGSLGEFFDVTSRAQLPAGNWLIQPPPAAAILAAAAARVIAMLEHDRDPNRVVLFVLDAPDARDAAAARAMLDAAKAKTAARATSAGGAIKGRLLMFYSLGPGAPVVTW
jgi:hypothetical protein